MRVCGGCGIVRMDAKACPHCAVAGNWVDAPDRVDGAFWVCALVKFKCRVCGFVVPLNHLDMDGGITCARCGVEQAFAVETWQSAIELAHATGDLAGARGEAAWSLPNVHQSKRAKREHEQSVLADAEYTFGRIGKSRWFAEIGPLGPSELHVTVSPGVALCAKCHTPFETRELDGEKTEVRCATCDATSTYRVPDAARKTSSALRSVVAPEHRCDRQAVKVIEASGQAALALVCPSCSASLPMSAVKDKLVTCTFCNMVARVPDRTWFRVSGKDPVPEAIWLLFNGPSARVARARSEDRGGGDCGAADPRGARSRSPSQRGRSRSTPRCRGGGGESRTGQRTRTRGGGA